MHLPAIPGRPSLFRSADNPVLVLMVLGAGKDRKIESGCESKRERDDGVDKSGVVEGE